MSQAGQLKNSGAIGAGIQTIQGNSGGPVPPNGANNIFVVGDGTTINVAGNAGTSTLTISAIPQPPIAIPAFQSTTSFDVFDVTGQGQFYQIICDTENFDLTNNYNPITGLFTAPSNGIYFFRSQINTGDDAISGNEIFINIYFIVNGNNTTVFLADPTSMLTVSQVPAFFTSNYTYLIQLQAGDTVGIGFQVRDGGGSPDTYDLFTGTQFGGWKIA